MTKCQGLIGRIFGHKFVRFDLPSLTSHAFHHCLRCGMPEGGWR